MTAGCPNTQRRHTPSSWTTPNPDTTLLGLRLQQPARPIFASVGGGRPKRELRREPEDRLSATVMAVFYHAHSQASSIVSPRLFHERIALLPRRCVHRARSRQLQH